MRVLVVAAASGLLWWLHGPSAALVVLAFTVAASSLGRLSRVPAFGWLGRLGSRAASLLGRALAFVVLAPVFFLFLTPFGLIARRGSRDRLARRLDRRGGSYWTEHPGERPMERPF